MLPRYFDLPLGGGEGLHHYETRDVDAVILLPPFLTSGPDLGVWPDCWISTEFLRALIPRKGPGNSNNE